MVLSRDADYADYLYTCNRCRSCATKHDQDNIIVCPSFAHLGYFSYCGGGRGYTAQGILEGKVKASEEVVKLAMHCLLCHACQTNCPPGFELTSVIRDLREWLVSQGIYSSKPHRRMLDHLRNSGNPWGMDPSKRLSAKKLGLKARASNAEALLFLGCHFGFGKSSLESEMKIIAAAHAKVLVMADEPCCGSPALELGDQPLFCKMAEKNIQRLNSLGVEKVITLCPHCTSALSNDYLEIGELEPEIVHFSEWLLELIDEGRLELKGQAGEMLVTFQDSCHLTRYLEQGDVARNLLSKIKGINLVEMERSRDAAFCCGGGSWANELMPELWRFTVRERLKEAVGTKASALITTCPYCENSFRKARPKRIEVISLAQLVRSQLAD